MRRTLNTMKKCPGIILLLVGIFAFAGCGSSDSDNIVDSTTPYPNAGLLVNVTSVDLNASDQVIIDTRTSSDYADGHIPGAINLEPSALDISDGTGLSASAALGSAGVEITNTIIVYGNTVDALAGKMFWILEYLGAEDVKVLNGGYTKWAKEGLTTSTDTVTLTSTTFTADVNEKKIATIDEMEEIAYGDNHENYAIISAQKSANFKAAHIPNAINMSTDDFLLNEYIVDDPDPNLDEKEKVTVLPYEQLKWVTDYAGVTSGKFVYIYDDDITGASQEYFIFRLIGFDVKVYTGTWSEWNNASTYPNSDLLVAAENVTSAVQVIIDTRSAADYTAGHVTGAINIEPSAIAIAYDLSETAAATALGSAGVSNTDTIVVYGSAEAGRMFWILEYLGCTDVHMLNGGLTAWDAVSGNTPVTAATTLTATTFNTSVRSSKLMTASGIAAKLENENFKIIDARTDEEFNGWKFYGETNGGHIPGAYQLPYTWFYNTDKTVLGYQYIKQIFEQRGITIDKEVTSYCYDGTRGGTIYFMLRLMGYNMASSYDRSMAQWDTLNTGDSTSYPLERAYANRYKDLVNPEWIKSVIDYHAADSTSAVPPEYKDTLGADYPRTHRYVILQTAWGVTGSKYNKKHISGALHANTDTWEIAPLYCLKDDATLQAEAAKFGITKDTTVIVYGDKGNFAARLWWLMKYIGVTDVRVLNGGINAWTAAAAKYGWASTYTHINENTSTTSLSTGDIPISVTGDLTAADVKPLMRATTAEALSHYRDIPTPMIDSRGGQAFLGIDSNYDYTSIAGRIWGAESIDITSSDADGTWASYTEAKTTLIAQGITEDRDAWFYCGDGYGVSQTFLMGYLMGFDKIRVYTDGWNTWSSVMDGNVQKPSGRPIERGLPTN